MKRCTEGFQIIENTTTRSRQWSLVRVFLKKKTISPQSNSHSQYARLCRPATVYAPQRWRTEGHLNPIKCVYSRKVTFSCIRSVHNSQKASWQWHPTHLVRYIQYSLRWGSGLAWVTVNTCSIWSIIRFSGSNLCPFFFFLHPTLTQSHSGVTHKYATTRAVNAVISNSGKRVDQRRPLRPSPFQTE